MSVQPGSVVKGLELPPLELHLTRADLVRYAGASGDLNPIHWSDRIATGAGLPGVIAHGMLTLGAAGRIVTDWVGDSTRVRSYGARFTRPDLRRRKWLLPPCVRMTMPVPVTRKRLAVAL